MSKALVVVPLAAIAGCAMHLVQSMRGGAQAEISSDAAVIIVGHTFIFWLA